MSERELISVAQTDLPEHPATQAWRQLRYDSAKPERIEILKIRPRNQMNSFERLVCRLVGVGPSGSAVIGKRCRRSGGLVERSIYEEILPYVPIPSLNFYGMVEDANEEFCWLFIEDAGEKVYSEDASEHRKLGSRWIGLMHVFASQVSMPSGLPGKGPVHYLERLQTVRETMFRYTVTHTLQVEDQKPLKSIIRRCDLLELRWEHVESLCESMPETLVHGDFAEKNLRVRTGHTGLAILPFDWGEAGWGAPAADIRSVDIVAYLAAVQSHWPWLDVHTIQQMSLAGRLFRCIDSIYWELGNLEYMKLAQPIINMRIYDSRLSRAMQAAGLEM